MWTAYTIGRAATRYGHYGLGIIFVNNFLNLKKKISVVYFVVDVDFQSYKELLLVRVAH